MREKFKKVCICNGCSDIKSFSFTGCAVTCQKFIDHLKVIFEKLESPCKELKCGVPGANFDHGAICKKCPLPDIYHKRIESSGGKWKCVLGKKNVTRYSYGEDNEYQ